MIDYSKFEIDELSILASIFSLSSLSIIISKSYTAIESDNTNIGGNTGLLLNLLSKYCNRKKKEALEILQYLQDNKDVEIQNLNNFIKNNSINLKLIEKRNIPKQRKNKNTSPLYEVKSYDFTVEEFEKIKNLTYLQYCDYLQNKYGIGQYAYMYPSFNRNQNSSRTKEGLIAHHKMENRAIMLSNPEYAKKWPYEWQLPENIVYCNMLEHLLLHILICKYPEPEPFQEVGIGGIIDFIVPELNDIYSGHLSKQEYKQNQYKLILDKKDLYFEILNFMKKTLPYIRYNDLCRSLSCSGLFPSDWDESKNERIYNKIKLLFKNENLSIDEQKEYINNSKIYNHGFKRKHKRLNKSIEIFYEVSDSDKSIYIEKIEADRKVRIL